MIIMLKRTLRSTHFDRFTSIWNTFSRMYSPGILGRSGVWLSNTRPLRSFWYCPWKKFHVSVSFRQHCKMLQQILMLFLPEVTRSGNWYRTWGIAKKALGYPLEVGSTRKRAWKFPEIFIRREIFKCQLILWFKMKSLVLMWSKLAAN